MLLQRDTTNKVEVFIDEESCIGCMEVRGNFEVLL